MPSASASRTKSFKLQTMKNRLGTQIIFFENNDHFDPLHKHTHIFIYFQHIGQMLNIAITQALL